MLKKIYIREYLIMFLFFLGIAFLGEQFGFYFSMINRLIGTFFLILYVSIINNYETVKNRILSFYAQLSMLMFLIIIAPIPSISVGLAILLPYVIGSENRDIEFQVGLVFFFYILFNSFIPQFFLFERLIADLFNNILRIVTTLSIEFSPYSYGFGGLVILVSFSIIQALRKNLLKKIVIIVSIIIVYLSLQVLYYSLSILYYNTKLSLMTSWRFWYSFLKLFFPMHGQGLIFVISFWFSVFMLNFSRNWNEILTNKELSNHGNLSLKLPIIALLGLILFSFYWNLNIYRPIDRLPRVYVYDTKMDFHTIPNENIYGMNNGMYGMMFKYFQDWGYDIELGCDWESINAENNDILFLFNPNEKMRPLNLIKIKDFIARGGRLLVLGDHTHMYGLKNPYFDFIEEMGIMFNFDTAMPFRTGWRKCLRSPLHTWDKVLKKHNFTSGINLGASLTVRYPAVPLIIGQYGWSDLGNIDNKPGYLGDRRFTPNEPTGDLVLAAERGYGKGEIIVFGDSSFIQNNPISDTYPIVQLCLSHLRPKNHVIFRLAVPSIFVIGLLLFFIFKNGQLKTVSCYYYLIMIFLFLIWTGVTISREDAYFNIPSKSIHHSAGIDFTTYPEFFRGDWERTNRGIGGLKNNLCRNDIIPYLIYQYNIEQLRKLDYFIIMAPKIKISRSKINELLQYVKNGGIVICACGFDQREQISGLLDSLNLDIENIPLSFLSEGDTNLGIRFVAAWPIKVSNNNAKIIGTAFGKYPVVVELALGKGKVLLISDPHFFENRNLEGNKVFYRNNISFVKQLIINLKQ